MHSISFLAVTLAVFCALVKGAPPTPPPYTTHGDIKIPLPILSNLPRPDLSGLTPEMNDRAKELAAIKAQRKKEQLAKDRQVEPERLKTEILDFVKEDKLHIARRR